MSAFIKLTEAVTCRYHDKIKKACAPLFESLNLCDFWYAKTKNCGRFHFFATHSKWTEHFVTEKFYLASPYHRHSKFLRPGISFLRSIPDCDFQRALDVSRDKFNVNPCLFLMNKTSDGIEGFGFSSNSSNQLQNIAFLSNEITLLKLFIKKFKEENRFLFSCSEDNQINLAEIFGPSFYEESAPVIFQPPGKQLLLKKLGIHSVSLTSRGKDVLRLLKDGLSARRIGEEIFLSKRTVEHHEERMKEKLGCESRAELIQKARELEYYGLLGESLDSL